MVGIETKCTAHPTAAARIGVGTILSCQHIGPFSVSTIATASTGTYYEGRLCHTLQHLERGNALAVALQRNRRRLFFSRGCVTVHLHTSDSAFMKANIRRSQQSHHRKSSCGSRSTVCWVRVHVCYPSKVHSISDSRSPHQGGNIVLCQHFGPFTVTWYHSNRQQWHVPACNAIGTARASQVCGVAHTTARQCQRIHRN